MNKEKCSNCIEFSKLAWSEEKGFCSYGNNRSKIIVNANGTCRHFDNKETITLENK